MSTKRNMFGAYISDKSDQKSAKKHKEEFDSDSSLDETKNSHKSERKKFKIPSKLDPNSDFIQTNQLESNLSDSKLTDESKLPNSIIPWIGKENDEQYILALFDAGFTSVKIIATSTVSEIHEVTGIPEHLVESLIENAKEWYDFRFETAATVLDKRTELVKIPTGSKQIDHLLGGGIESKSITELYGEFTTGKTQLCLTLTVNATLPTEFGGLGGDAVYIDSEGSFRPERITQMIEKYNIDPEIVLDHILVARAYNSDFQMKLTDNVIQLAKDHNIKLVVLDSLTSNFRAEYIGKNALLDRQQKLNRHVQQLVRIADILNVAVVVTNQVMNLIDGYENTIVPVGGNIVAHGTTHRVHLIKSNNNSIERIAKLISSPSLPNGSAMYKITRSGIEDL